MTIRWLHLSDTHFREDELWDRRATLKALITKASELKKKGLAPELVFVTGDIAFSGRPKEYEQAKRFFQELNEVLDLDPKERWFLVPGNHDVDRSRITRSHRAIQTALSDETIVEETLRDSDAMKLLSTRLNAYYNFAADFLGPARALQPERPWRTDVRIFDNIAVGILQLNSAWIAEGGLSDEANLLVGEAQVREAFDATPDVFLRIALMHHPLRNLRQFDADRVESLLLAFSGAAFLLRGHLHLNRTTIQQTPDGHLLQIAAGTLYTDDANWPRGFNIGEVNLHKGEALIHLFRYSPEGKGFFASDNLTYENAPDGVAHAKLPTNYCLGRKKTRPSKPVSESQRTTFTARYRNASANYHGYARFIGFPNQATRPNARVSDLFVPLRMKQRSGIESRTTAWIAQRLLGPPITGRAHIVVLGDPGSGKTTLSRFLVMLAAGEITMPGVEVVGEPLPLRIALRDFVEKRRESPSLSLLDYLELQARTELSLFLPKNFLRNAIETGRAILLLDGLDEVGAPEHRAAIRDLVASFSSTHGNLPILVTSRIAGYDDAPLAGQAIAVSTHPILVLFFELVLDKFDDDDLRAFVTRWYCVQEPTDPVARDRGIADLLSALAADDRVRELARTPILSTLIAMIHRVEANLPGERAKLYELCVRMLLETWPAQAKRPFVEIDAGLQRAYLESLAYSMHIGREKDAKTVVVTHSGLIAKLLPILRKRDFASEPEEKVAGVIERWIDHLETHSGILVEQSTGVYAFFHLSIMEYLAALGMERDLGRDSAVETIAQRFEQSAWREVCLLAVGSHAEDGDFLDSIYERVSISTRIERWNFLLRCLREEARFRPEQRDSILGEAALTLLRHGPSALDTNIVVDQIRRFSVRHAEGVTRWMDNRLGHSLGIELAATASLETDFERLLGHLSSRTDQHVAASELLEFWPGSALGEWSAGKVDAQDALSWSCRTPRSLAPLRAIAALKAIPEHLAAASVIALTARTLQFCKEGMANVARVCALPRPRGFGLPERVKVKPGNVLFSTSPRFPTTLKPHANPHELSTRVAGGMARHFARNFVHALSDEYAQQFVGSVAEVLARDFALEFGLDVSRELVVNGTASFVQYFDRDFANRFGRSFRGDRRSYLVSWDVGESISFDFADSAPVSQRPIMQYPGKAMSGAEAHRAAEDVIAAMAGEAFAALATMAGSESEDERFGYVLYRIQNRWLFEIWRSLDRRLADKPTPSQLALYFALSWAQSTTTWAWPNSERWRTLFAAGPKKIGSSGVNGISASSPTIRPARTMTPASAPRSSTAIVTRRCLATRHGSARFSGSRRRRAERRATTNVEPVARLRRWAQTRVSVPHWPLVFAGGRRLAGPNVAQTPLSVLSGGGARFPRPLRIAMTKASQRLASKSLMHFPVSLQSHPELGRGLEQPSEPKSGVSAHAALPVDYLVQSVQRDPELPGSVGLTEALRFQELLEKDLAGRDRRGQPVWIPDDHHIAAPNGTIRDIGR